MPRVDIEHMELACFGMDTLRWHTRPNMGTQNVGHHTSRCLWFCFALVEKPREELLFAILSHDAAEWKVGDMPGQVKACMSEGYQEELVNLEFATLEEMGVSLPQLEEWESWMVAFCDAMEGLLYSRERIACGVSYAKEPARNYLKRVQVLVEDWQEGWPVDIWERVRIMLKERMPTLFKEL